MPDWTNYSFSYATGTSASAYTFVTSDAPLTALQIEQAFEEYKREQERQDSIYELQMQQLQQEMEEEMENDRQLQEDKRKYPLFFLKKGIV